MNILIILLPDAEKSPFILHSRNSPFCYYLAIGEALMLKLYFLWDLLRWRLSYYKRGRC